MSQKILIGFDFSMNKPAMCVLHNGHLSFNIWPLNMSKKQVDLYDAYGVKSLSRNLPEMKPSKESVSKIVWEHTKRSVALGDMIADAVLSYVNYNTKEDEEVELYIASEGLSYGSTGDAMLNLASYKGVMLGKLYERLNGRITRLCTYPPIAVKSTAKCATKEKRSEKNAMITAFIEDERFDTEFKRGLLLNKFSTPKKNYIKCVDDLVDSYWVLMTMIKKEGIDIS